MSEKKFRNLRRAVKKLSSKKIEEKIDSDQGKALKAMSLANIVLKKKIERMKVVIYFIALIMLVSVLWAFYVTLHERHGRVNNRGVAQVLENIRQHICSRSGHGYRLRPVQKAVRPGEQKQGFDREAKRKNKGHQAGSRKA